MEKIVIGVYRTVFPHLSETFISEQMRALVIFSPTLVVRDLLQGVGDLPVISIGDNKRFAKKICFSVFGMTFGFNNLELQRNLQLIHAHFAPDAALILPLANKLHIPLIVTCHGSDVTVSNVHIAKSLKVSGFRYLLGKRRLLKDVSLFIAVSDFLKKKMIENGFPKEKIMRHYVGVDTTRFVPLSHNNTVSDRAPFILSIARHTDVKGLDLLLKAFAAVKQTNPFLRLVQIGGGPLTHQLKALACSLKIEDDVDFLGAMPSEMVLPYIQQCNALVLSSRKSITGAEEAFGLVVIEASACGVPCVGTRVGGIPEAIVDGVTGFLVAPENIGDLAEKISLLVSDPMMASKMGRRGREMVCESFDLKKQTQKLEALYAQVIDAATVCKS